MDGHVWKPVDPHGLYEAILRWLRQRPPEPAEDEGWARSSGLFATRLDGGSGALAEPR